jgi:hypothetical protein
MTIQVTSSLQILVQNEGKEKLWHSRKGNHSSWYSSIIEGIKTWQQGNKKKGSRDERLNRVIKWHMM